MSDKQEKPIRRVPVVFIQPQKGQSVDDLVDALAQPVIDSINESRKARGLPPLPKG
jgi:hypothetical protein